MRLVHTVSVTENREVTDDIICNRCGGSCRTRIGNYEGLVEAVVEGGDGALLGDMVRFTFSICEKCLGQIFLTFKHSPERVDLMAPIDEGEES